MNSTVAMNRSKSVRVIGALVGIAVLGVGTGMKSAHTTEDCTSFNPKAVAVAEVKGHWKLTDGKHWLFDFGGNKARAQRALEVVEFYGANSICSADRPKSPFMYLRVAGKAPTGGMAGEDCLEFATANTHVESARGEWKLMDGNSELFDFGKKKKDAVNAAKAVNKYQFTHSCFVGREPGTFRYLRR